MTINKGKGIVRSQVRQQSVSPQLRIRSGMSIAIKGTIQKLNASVVPTIEIEKIFKAFFRKRPTTAENKIGILKLTSLIRNFAANI